MLPSPCNAELLLLAAFLLAAAPRIFVCKVSAKLKSVPEGLESPGAPCCFVPVLQGSPAQLPALPSEPRHRSSLGTLQRASRTPPIAQHSWDSPPSYLL